MTFSKKSLELMNKASKLYEELSDTLDSLRQSVLRDTDKRLIVCNPFPDMKYIHIVDLEERKEGKLNLEELADEGSIHQVWDNEDAKCLGFDIKGNKCIILFRKEYK